MLKIGPLVPSPKFSKKLNAGVMEEWFFLVPSRMGAFKCHHVMTREKCSYISGRKHRKPSKRLAKPQTFGSAGQVIAHGHKRCRYRVKRSTHWQIS
jgi:hypothetical protein